MGEEFKKALEASCHPERSEGSHASWFPDSEALAAALAAEPVRDAVILIKGSRGIQMEIVLNCL